MALILAEIDRGRNLITGCTERGLTVQINNQTQEVGWDAVRSVYAGRGALSDDVWILALIFDLHIDSQSRTLVAAEVEPAWIALTERMPAALAGIPKFSEWGPALLACDDPIILYDQA